MYHKAPLMKQDMNKRRSSSGQMNDKFLQGASYDTYSASMTLEMVVILPLFVSFMVFFLFLFRVLLVQQQIERALVYTAQEIAVKCYEETVENQNSHAKLLAGAQLTFYKKLQESDGSWQFIKGGCAGISLLESETQGDDIILRADYQMRAPCILLGTYSYQILQSAQSRKWIGNCTLESQKNTEQWVYITPYGTVYHRSRNCRYLDLSIRVINQTSVVTERNADGKIYHRCDRCKATGKPSVYVTDYGTQYHSSLSCSALKRTIYMIKLSQVGGKKACSKCGAM